MNISTRLEGKELLAEINRHLCHLKSEASRQAGSEVVRPQPMIWRSASWLATIGLGDL